MSTVDKALGLLSFFSLSKAEWGLSDIARAAGLDKATTLRLLRAMAGHRMIEQDRETKKFRLGPAFLTLARVREESVPLTTVLNRWLDDLAETTGETAHASIATPTALTTISISEPRRSTRVWVDPSQPLPFHATASGLVYLAFGPDEVREKFRHGDRLETFTDRTPSERSTVWQLVEQVRQTGFAVGSQTFEDEAVGIAVPLFDGSGLAQGAMAVVSPTMRLDDDLKQKITRRLMQATLDAGEGLGSKIPASFRQLAEAYVR